MALENYTPISSENQQATPSIAVNPSQFAILSFAEIEAMRECAASDWRVYSILSLHANGEGDCWPGRKRIGSMADLSPDHVSRSISYLESLGLVERRKGRTGITVYHLPLHRIPRQEQRLPNLVASPAEPLPNLAGLTEQDLTDHRERAPATPKPANGTGVPKTSRRLPRRLEFPGFAETSVGKGKIFIGLLIRNQLACHSQSVFSSIYAYFIAAL